MSSINLPVIKGADTKALFKVIDRVQADHSGLDEDSILEAETLWSVMTRVSDEVNRMGLLPPITAEEKQRQKHLKSLQSKRKKVAQLEAAEKVKGEFAEEEAALDARIAAHEAANPQKAKRKGKPTGSNAWGNFRKAMAAERKKKELPKWGMDEYGAAWGQLSEEQQAEYGPGGRKAPKAKAPVVVEFDDEEPWSNGAKPLSVEDEDEAAEKAAKKAAKRAARKKKKEAEQAAESD